MTETKERIFYPGKWYLATSDNKIVRMPDFKSCQENMLPDDTILLGIPAKDMSKPVKADKPKLLPPAKAKKIIVDFNKNLLTVEGNDVKIGVDLFKVGSTQINTDRWETFLPMVRKAAEVVEVVGVPPIAGKDITNEMSDL